MGIASNLSLYDTLTMLVNGCLLLFLFIRPDMTERISLSDGVFLVVSIYIIGLVYHKIIECLSTCKLIKHIGGICPIFDLRNNRKIIHQSYTEIKKENENDFIEYFKQNDYLKAYYIVVKNGGLMNIPTLEAQVAFIRNIIPILLIYLIALFSEHSIIYTYFHNSDLNICYIQLLLFIFSILLLKTAEKIQYKIHYLIWEGAYFYEKIKKEEHASQFGTK